MKTTLPVLLLGLAALSASAQVVDQPAPKPAPAPAQSSGGGNGGGGNNNANSQSSFLSKDVPFFDPDNETVTWDGKSWNVTNNRVFQARFEKYLNAPAEDDAKAAEYDALLAQIRNLRPNLPHVKVLLLDCLNIRAKSCA